MSIDVRAPAYRALADELRSQITSGQLRPGDRLPTEPQLCRDCGVSRSTVREALRLLASQHLIVTTRGVAGGSFVAHPSPEQMADTLATGVKLLQVNSIVDADQLLEVREIFEAAAAGFAALRRRPDDLETLRSTLFDPLSADFDTMCTQHLAFHSALIAACGNPVLELVTKPLHRVVNLRELLAHLDREFWVRLDREHRAIFDAVSAGRPAEAERAAAAHLRTLREQLVEDNRLALAPSALREAVDETVAAASPGPAEVSVGGA